MSRKASRSAFLARNPFPQPYTAGLFYREKMRAIHQIAPDCGPRNVLEIGGGRSGLTTILYPTAIVINLDLDSRCADAAVNTSECVRFVVGDATVLPFAAGSFDGVTMFDLIEHVSDDVKAIAEARRVLKPGGFFLITTPNENWRFPYYSLMRSVCPSEAEKLNEWGHVRRGYTQAELERLIGAPPVRTATFINPLTVLSHDIGMSKLRHRWRMLAWMALAPITAFGYLSHRQRTRGTETAYLWIKSAA